MTSIANTLAASGVPNRAAKPAAMPHMVIVRESRSSSRIQWPILPEIAPPSCSAAPSRPAEPPHRCVSTEVTKMLGASRSRTGWFSRTEVRIKLVPRSSGISAFLYQNAMNTPTTGSRYSSQPCASRISPAHSSAWWNTAPTAPTTTPIITANAHQRTKISAFLACFFQ